MKPLLRQLVDGRRSEFVRFLIGGIANTAFSYAIYLLLLILLPAMHAYVISFIIGIVSGYLINSIFVFPSKLDLKRFAAFPLVHLVNLSAGSAILWLAIHVFGCDARIAPLLSIAATIPINFVLSRIVVKH
ncbi:GtrA family protein [Lysobacter brunescens]|uniref:GtrA family protein n=1 Tax=Lysobacter brunescens TaxID=262323 RepID=A0ABW2YA21_9GAMM